MAAIAIRANSITDQRKQLRAARLSHDQIALEADVGPNDVPRADATWRRCAPAPFRGLLVAKTTEP